MVRLNVSLRASSARNAQELLSTLRFLGSGIRLEPGCIECSAWVEPDATVHYAEGWMTEPDVRRRVRSSAFTSLLGVMECASEPPDVHFEFVTETRGLDFVAEVRAGNC